MLSRYPANVESMSYTGLTLRRSRLQNASLVNRACWDNAAPVTRSKPALRAITGNSYKWMIR
jgi:hypothetical protein